MNILVYLLALATICMSANLYVYGQNIKSQNSSQRVLVRFVNQSNRRASVVWIDYSGNPYVYKILAPYKIFDAFTFTSHPWIFQDAVTAERLLANNQIIFYPTVLSYSDSLTQVIYTDKNEYRVLVAITEPRSCCASGYF